MIVLARNCCSGRKLERTTPSRLMRSARKNKAVGKCLVKRGLNMSNVETGGGISFPIPLPEVLLLLKPPIVQIYNLLEKAPVALHYMT